MNPIENPVNIVCLDRNAVPDRIQLSDPHPQRHWTNHPSSHPEQVIERAKNADILVTSKVNINDEVLAACPKLKHIAVTATGYNVIDIPACEARGISVSNVPSYAATTVSEHVIGTAIMLRRKITEYAQAVNDGRWQTANNFCLFDKPFHNISGATIGLIGMGEIAEATAAKAHALGMTVLFTTRTKRNHAFAEQVALPELLSRSDIVSVHCSLNDSTKDLIGVSELNLMPNHSILINTARGGIVNEAAAVAAISDHSIGGLAFDVMEIEPPHDKAPLLSIAERSNVIITPHIAWASEQAMQYLAHTVSRNIDAFINGHPINLVTKQ